MPVAYIVGLIGAAKTVLDTLKNFKESSGKQRLELIEAHLAINSAFIKTTNFLRNSDDGYSPNVDLAQAWNEACAKVMVFDKTSAKSYI